MEPSTVALIGLALMAAFMMIGMPIAFAMLLAGVLGNAYMLPSGAASHLLATNLWEQFSSYGLSVVPMVALVAVGGTLGAPVPGGLHLGRPPARRPGQHHRCGLRGLLGDLRLELGHQRDHGHDRLA
jgi:hypothetical protein